MITYQLMNANRVIADLYISNGDIHIDKFYAQLPNFIFDINEWVNNRSTLFGRRNVLKLAKLAGINSTEDFLKIASFFV